MSGLFAINKPSGISSAGLLNDLQNILKVSPLFEAEIKAQQARTNAGRKGRKQKMGNKIKMGHGGTLDPLASGVLVVGTGRGTKDLGKFLNCSKDYEAIALFGCSTDTYDSEGKIVHQRPWRHITKERLESVLSQFRGDIMQTPPIYSALKMQGKPLYEYAREGKPLPAEIKARAATVSRFEVTKFTTDHEWRYPKEAASTEIVLSAEALEGLHTEKSTETTNGVETGPVTASIENDGPREDASSPSRSSQPPAKRIRRESPPRTSDIDFSDEPALAVHLKMTVSSGTYVRSLIHDLGLALGSAAHMVALVRKRVGEFKLEESIAWPAFEQDEWQESLKKRLDFGDSEEQEDDEVETKDESLTIGTHDAVDDLVASFLGPCRPFRKTLTYAQSIDAKISGPRSTPLTISCPESFRVTHELRRAHDIILIGVGTAESDNPGLNARSASGKPFPLSEQPIPVILDPNGRFNLTSASKMMKNVLIEAGKLPLQLVHQSRRGTVESSATIIYVQSSSQSSKDGKYHLSWHEIYSALAEYGESIMIEGGARIIKDVLQLGVADQVIVTIAPTYIGEGTSLSLDTPTPLAKVRSQIFGRDTVLCGQVRN